ncbi:hypothetical protein COCMIDRAFT_3468 [Bipolaris oryzae ATCC 44560]|uniref:Cytochrome P450 monooxygenase n=1 Tax=Bipolaris oryzae ATCC 44560 TaxID=930090 RepID=W6ZV90_COCMI|nr:uncharacterized protein COCMIDRAFT_3468 [Bipolaris oryzae ATCC 44560]EUC47676.1 hypothetical protein COCMIDRAFT_3468 [Bipolaris oryzae ATCC 44560]
MSPLCIYGNDPEWKEVTTAESILALVARLSTKVFLGDELCRNEDWLRITKEYTLESLAAGIIVSTFPSLLQPLVPFFSQKPKIAKNKLNEVRNFLNPILAERQRRKAEAKKKGEPAPKYEDTLEWLQQESDGAPLDAALYQMALSFAAIHTTSDLLNRTLTHLANDPNLVNDLRQEIVQVLSVDGLKKIALANLKLMDSAIKETQRITPTSAFAMRRVAKEKVVLPNGFVIQRGQYISVDMMALVDADVYPDPLKFDAYRYYRMREDPQKAMKAHLVSTTPDNLSFGLGYHSCPGRFFAANEVKIALCHLLLKYDWQLAPGASLEPYNMFAENVGFDPSNKLRYRRRQEELNTDSLNYD